MNNQEKEASDKVMQLITATWINQPLYVVTKLEIPDLLSDKSMTIKELSDLTDTYSPFLYRVMRALSSIGFFYEEDNKRFSITSMGKILTKDKMNPIIQMFVSEWHNRAWDKLFYSVKTGKTAFDKAFGKSCFNWLQENPDEAKSFNMANQIKSYSRNTIISETFDFSEFKSIIDLGGGYGGLLISILKKYPDLNGTIADLPYMMDNVLDQIKHNKLNSRCDFIGCNFFEKIPRNYDCYLLSNILHDWEDNKCIEILQKCSTAMKKDSKLIIIEAIVPNSNEFSFSKLLDLEVLVMGKGKERTKKEYLELLNKSNLNISNITKISDEFSIILCNKID